MNKILIFLLGLIFFFSCAPLPEESAPSSVVLKMPKSDYFKRSSKTSRNIKAVVNTSSFGGTDLAIIDDIDCYAVAISHVGTGSCQGSTSISGIEFLSYTVSDGGEVTMDEVPTEVPLVFHIIGFSKGALGICPEFRTITTDDMQKMGRPFVVGSTATKLEAIAENIVTVDISMSNAHYLNSCGGFPFDWAAGGAFGTARFGQSKFGP